MSLQYLRISGSVDPTVEFLQMNFNIYGKNDYLKNLQYIYPFQYYKTLKGKH